MINKSRDQTMPLTGHLDELRTRMILSALAVLVTSSLAFVFADQLLLLLKAPGGSTSAKLYVLRACYALFTDGPILA